MAATTNITVYCDDSHHSERRWEIARFARSTVGTGWRALPDFRFKSQRQYLAGEVKTMVWLEDEHRYLALGEPFPIGARVRLRPWLRCKACDLALRCTDMTELNAVFDKMADAGISVISLRNLITLLESLSVTD